MAGRLPSLRPTQIIRALEKCGVVVDHQTGGHIILWKEGLLRPVPISRHNDELPPGVTRKILRQLDVSEEEFLKHV